MLRSRPFTPRHQCIHSQPCAHHALRGRVEVELDWKSGSWLSPPIVVPRNSGVILRRVGKMGSRFTYIYIVKNTLALISGRAAVAVAAQRRGTKRGGSCTCITSKPIPITGC